jgi:hypothetical protein
LTNTFDSTVLKVSWQGLLASVAAASGHKDHKWKRRFFVLKVSRSSNSRRNSDIATAVATAAALFAATAALAQ